MIAITESCGRQGRGPVIWTCAVTMLVTVGFVGHRATGEDRKLVFPQMRERTWYERDPSSLEIYYEHGSNTISVPGEDGQHVQKVSPEIETQVFEAEKLRAMGTYPQMEWIASPVGYHDKYPNDDVLNDHSGGVSVIVSGKYAMVYSGPGADHIWEDVTIERGGKYHLWVRYQDVYGRPEPFEVSVQQEGAGGSFTFGQSDTSNEFLGAALVWVKKEMSLKAGHARLDLRKPGDADANAAPRFVDQIMITNDLNYIPVGPVQLSWPQVQRQLNQLGATGQRFVVWSQDPWANFSNKSWPESKRDLDPKLAMRACVGEREQLMYMVTNTSDNTINVNIAVTLRREGRPAADAIKVSVVPLIRSKRFGWVPDVMVPYDKLGAVAIAPYHTAALWVEVDTTGLQPGDYVGRLSLVHGNGRKLIPFDLNVLSAKLPVELDIFTLGWGYAIDLFDPEKVRFLSEHGINTVAGPVSATPEVWRKYRMKYIVNNQSPTGMYKRGYRKDEFYFFVGDEPGDGSFQSRVAESVNYKAQDPEILIEANPTWNKHASMPTFEGLDGHVDMWIPYITHLRYPDALSLMRRSGGKIGFYKCDGFLSKNPTMCYNYYRKFPWVTFYYQIDGCGFWSMSQTRGHPWYDLDHPRMDGSGTDPVTLYPDESGYYATRAMEGFREGTEDYKYLMLLRDKVDREELNFIAKRMLRSVTVQDVAAVRDELLDLVEVHYP